MLTGLVFGATVANAAQARTGCRPVAVIEGPREIVAATDALLRAHGLESTPSGCNGEQVVQAIFAAGDHPSRFDLRIRDGYGHVSERLVDDAQTAATLIETWAANEDTDLVSPAGPLAASAVPALVVHSTDKKLPRQWRVSTAFERSIGSDGSQWYGGVATACTLVGGFCLGGRLRVDRDDGDTGPADVFDQTQTSAEFLAVASRPQVLGPMFVAPLVGVGAAWTKVSPQAGTDTDPASRYGLRFEVAVAGGLPLSRSWSMTVELGAEIDALSSQATSASGFSIGPAVLYRGSIGVMCFR